MPSRGRLRLFSVPGVAADPTRVILRTGVTAVLIFDREELGRDDCDDRTTRGRLLGLAAATVVVSRFVTR